MSDEPQAVVKILDFIDGKWQIDPGKLPDGDGRPLAIITCIGDFGVGKSFLNNVLLNCLLLGDSSFDDEAQLLKVFPTENSNDSETKGIDMYSQYMHFGENCAVALWDTEGPSDPNRSQENASNIFGLSIYFSSVVIFNIKHNFTRGNMDKLQVFLQTMRDCTNSSNEGLFQDLVIVVRDWSSAEFGYCWEGGQDYMDSMLSETCPDGQTQAFFKELKYSFKSVKVFLMPPPDQQLMWKPSPVGIMKDVGVLFQSCLRILAMQIVHDILKPRKIDGKELNTDNLKEYLISMETTFATSDASCPNTLAYYIKDKRIQQMMNQTLQEYQEKLFKNRGWLSREASRRQQHENLKQSFMTSFKENVTAPYIEDNLTNTSVQVLSDLIEERFAAYNSGALFAQKVMWIVAGVVIGAGAVAVVVFCPAVVTGIQSIISSPITRKIVSEAVPLLVPLVKEAAAGTYTSNDMHWDKSLYAVVSKLSPST